MPRPQKLRNFIGETKICTHKWPAWCTATTQQQHHSSSIAAIWKERSPKREKAARTQNAAAKWPKWFFSRYQNDHLGTKTIKKNNDPSTYEHSVNIAAALALAAAAAEAATDRRNVGCSSSSIATIWKERRKKLCTLVCRNRKTYGISLTIQKYVHTHKCNRHTNHVQHDVRQQRSSATKRPRNTIIIRVHANIQWILRQH